MENQQRVDGKQAHHRHEDIPWSEHDESEGRAAVHTCDPRFRIAQIDHCNSDCR
jgi:hypothetical protein